MALLSGAMGIARTVEWAMTAPPEEAQAQLANAMSSLDMAPQLSSGSVRGRLARSLHKNRWAADVTVTITPLNAGTRAIVRVDMGASTKHYEVLNDLADAIGDEAFADRGIDLAIERLGKFSRVFGRKEVRHLRHLVHADETVITLAQGTYSRKQGIVVLQTSACSSSRSPWQAKRKRNSACPRSIRSRSARS